MSDPKSKFTVSCQECGLNALCLPYSLTLEEIDQVDQTVKRNKPLHRSESVYQSGDRFTSIYAVRSGAIKAYSIDEEGEEHVIGFYLPGEIFGLDAIDAQSHLSAAKALETTAICEIPYEQVGHLSGKIHNLQAHMYRLFSREIRADQQIQILLGKKTAEERIGAFLLNLSQRYSQRRLSATKFRLPMARTDIGNYLGLAVETVSRVFTRLQKHHVLKVDGKEIEILNHKKLCELSHNECPLL
ncbi:MAG: fumarate/nitrate reduction transcriptional regulator Fnr [Pseudomonadales bacterium]